MPIAIWLMIIGQGLAQGHTLLTSIKGKDHNVQHRVYVEPQSYRVWTAPASTVPKKGCAGSTYALATRNKVVRLQVNGEEQILDYAWRFDHKLMMGDHNTTRYEFIDPVTREVLACRDAYVSCEVGWNELVFKHGESLCYDQLSKPNEESVTGKPRLVVKHPNFVTFGIRNVGGVWTEDGKVTIIVRIEGELNEQWYCPEIQVEWPDDTRSHKYSDCDPWIGSDEQKRMPQSWSFSHAVAPAESIIVTVRLLKAGKVFRVQRIRMSSMTSVM